MIFGECPYCDYPMVFGMPERSPAFSRQTCEACAKTFWEYHSRVDPVAYTEDEFAALFGVDEATMTIRRRDAQGER